MMRYLVMSFAVLFISCKEWNNSDSSNGQHPLRKIYNDVKTNVNELKTNEDDLISAAIVGNVYLDDEYSDDILYKDIRMKYDDNGFLSCEVTSQMYIQEIDDNIEIFMRINGVWNVKDKYLYYKFNDASLSSSNQLVQAKIEEGYFSKEDMLNRLNSKNTPEKVIYYGPEKIVTKDADGKETVFKKSY